MGYRYICEHCGAHLDPGERCDCQETEKKEKAATVKIMFPYERRSRNHAGRKVCV